MPKNPQPRLATAVPQLDSHLRLYGEGLPVTFWTTDAGLRFTSLRGSGVEKMGHAPDNLNGVSVFEFFQTGDPSVPIIAAFLGALEGKPSNFEANWEGRTYDVYLEPLRRPDGTIAGTIGVAFDLTGRKVTQTALQASERPFRALVENSSDMMALVSPDGAILYASPSTTRILGYPVEEFVGRDAFEMVHPDDCRGAQQRLADLIRDPGRSVTVEFRFRDRWGAWRWMEGAASNQLDEPDVQAIVVNYREISERKRAEAERHVIFEIIHGVNATANLDELLHRIHQALKKVLYAENCFVALHDPATGMFHFPFFVDRFDTAPPPQEVGRSCTAYVFRTGRPMLIPQKAFDELAARGEVELVGTPSPTWLGVPLHTPSRTIGVLVVQHYEDENAYTERDLEFLASVGGQIALAIERKQAEDALRASENRLRAIIETEPECVKLVSDDGTLLEMNPAGLAMIEADSIEQLAGKCVYPIVCPEFRNEFRAFTERVCRGHKGSMEFEIQGLRGTRRWMETYAVPLSDPSNGRTMLLGVTRDVTERRRAEEALRRSEADYRSLVQNAPYGIYRVTLNGRLLNVNPSLVEMLGYASEAELLAVNMAQEIWRDPEARGRLLKSGVERIEGVEVDWKRKDGAPITVRLSGRLRTDPGVEPCYELIAENVTEHRKLEQQLRQAQKMEAVGRLAGGVAHDFNNLLMVIQGHTELLLDRLEVNDSEYRNVKQIREAADRAASLTRQLLAFSRMQVLQPKVLDPNEIVTEMARMLPRLIGEDIEMVLRIDPALGRVKADPGQLEQVILNLAVNARDAMPQGGKLVIETANAELDAAYARRHPPLLPGRYVMLAVTDTGVGMDAETQARIFEPFFTTKEKGRGTGLGLATVYGVVKQSGGYIWVYSEPEQGSTFKIYLPRVEEVAESRRPKAEGESPAGAGTILLAEDEHDVREIAREFLTLSGYTVLECTDGIEALEVARRHSGPIDLLLTDIVMPGMGGRELTARLKPLRPDMKVIYMSGYTDYANFHDADPLKDAQLLAKPFSRATLARTVRQALGERKAS